MASIIWFFIVYSFAGFLLEVLFARITRAAKQDRKCLLFLPLCPVYGLGSLLILLLPAAIKSRPVLLFLAGALTATAAEYFMDWFYEAVFRVRFWNYSALPLNLNGRVCLLFSAIWGLLAIGLVDLIHPAVARWISLLPTRLALPALLAVLADFILTALLLRAAGSTSALRWYDRFRHPRKERS